MPKIPFAITTLAAQLEGDLQLGGALLFPEWTTLGEEPARIQRQLLRGLEGILLDESVMQYHRRRLCGETRVEQVTLTIDPPKQSTNTWREGVTLTFDAVCWQHHDNAHVAFVPALDLEVLAETEEQLPSRIEHEIRFALMRSAASTSLKELIDLNRIRRLQLTDRHLEIDVPTAKQRAIRELAEEEQRESVLSEVADDLRKTELAPAFERSVDVARLADLLTQRFRTCVLLVGNSGVGKTAIVHELVRRAEQHNLAGTPFWATSGARLVAGMSGFGMWQDRCTKLIKEASKRRAVLHVGSLFELSEVGKSIGNEQGIADFLRPAMARGELIVIAEATSEQLAALGRSQPQLLDAFAKLEIESPGESQGRAILNRVVSLTEQDRRQSTVPSESLDTLARLHHRWATYSAWPGRPLRFLRNLLKDHELPRDHEGPREISPRDVITAFSQETGLPRVLLDDDVPLDLAATRDWFSTRVLGQDEPVDLVVNLLAAVKTDVTRAGRPIASLLFIGPTGVGKTEMAKTLAEFLYQDPHRMVRFDMSEYSDPAAIGRLIGGSCDTQGLLTQQVRQQPFGVVLLDELEKAHPSFFDLLLQILGEGRLTDAGGRVADFTNSVVIMTSNLGAATFRHGGLGFAGDAQTQATARRSAEHFTRETREFFRPELFNRLDRIVPFQPLPKDVVRRIVDRRLEELQERDGVKFRDVNWVIPAEIADQLAERGYSSAYGARPVARTIERDLTIPLAKRLNGYAGELPIAVKASLEEQRIAIDVKVRKSQTNENGQSSGTGLLDVAREITDLRRLAQRVSHSSAMTAIRNELFRLEDYERRLAKDKSREGDPKRYEHLSAMHRLQKQVTACDTALADIITLENDLLVAFYRRESYDVNEAREMIAVHEDQLFGVARTIYLSRFDQPNRLTLVILGEDNARVLNLTKAYEQWARDRQGQVMLYQLVPHPDKLYPPKQQSAHRKEPTYELPQRAESPPEENTEIPIELDAYQVSASDSIYESPRKGLVGIGMELICDNVFPMLIGEYGLHVFRWNTGQQHCLVETSDLPLRQYETPPGATRKGAFKDEPVLREYNSLEGVIEEKQVGRFSWNGRQVAGSLDDLLEKRFRAHVWRGID